MAAPTPVSSLVHRSTLVTAGVYLILVYFFFVSHTLSLTFLFSLGMITLLVRGTMSLAEKDAKKLVALRTLSQLGFIFTFLGHCCPVLVLLHLLAHAFFKSCLFLQVGHYIISFASSQEGRAYRSMSPSTSLLFITLSCLRMCGMCFIRGFVRKDLLLAVLFSKALR